jgi:ABC-type transport system involved in multi-copper enzyme maturation permease subunit
MERELRAEARHAFSYWLRALGASVLLIVLALMLIDAQDNTPGLGAKLFGNLNTALFITIWLLVPLLTADCLSRERREGTLGILFLTPLTARAIIIGKGLIHSLRALTMVLAALPVVAVPFLLGGVTWREGLMALLLDLSSVGLALAVGLVASAYCRHWNRALLFAEVLSAMTLFVFGVLLILVLIVQVAIPYFPGFARSEVPFGEIIMGGAIMCTDIAGMWSEAIKFLPIAATRAWLAVVVEIAGGSLLIFGLAIIWVARRLERSRQERPATARQLWWQNYLFAPRFWKELFRSKMRRTLERNPIGWLQQYSTGARMTKWGWCLFIVIAECMLVPIVDPWYDLLWPQYWLLLLVALSLAASAASSFRRERETGALELILVTPLSELEIILGRLFGLWKQFLPALGMLLAVLAFLLHIGPPWDQWHGESYLERDLAVAALVACTFATLPVVGLYFSLSLKHFLSAWLSALGVCVLLPVILPCVLVVALTLVFGSLADDPFLPRVVSFANLPVLTGGFQTVFALIAMTRLYFNLQERKFALAS